MLAFELPNVAGNTVKLEDYHDQKGVVVVFTCNHCPYAIAYEQRLIKLHQDFESRGVPFVAISSNDARQYPQDSFENMKVRAEQKGFPFPYLYDESQDIAHEFGAERTPHVFLLRKEENGFKQVYEGAIDDNYEDASKVSQHYLIDAIEKVIAGEAPEVQHTKAIGCSMKWKH